MSIKWQRLLIRYAAEILIIFTGITISFGFEEWRNSQEANHTLNQQLLDLNEDLTRLQSWIKSVDSAYINTLDTVKYVREGNLLTVEEFSTFFFTLIVDPENFSLRDLSPYLTTVAESEVLSQLEQSEQIITRISYIRNLSRVDHELSKSMSEYANQHVWSKINVPEITDGIANGSTWQHSYTYNEADTVIWLDDSYTIEQLNPALISDLDWLTLKMRHLLGVHLALHSQIEHLKKLLNEAADKE